MKNHNNGDDDGNNGGNKDGKQDGNDDGNATSRLGSDDPIFDPIAMPRSRLGLAEEGWATTTAALRLRHHMYLHV